MRRGIVALVVLSLSTAGTAFADPVTLTSGSLSVGGFQMADGFGSFGFSGNGFTGGGSGNGSVPGDFIEGFSAGTVNLSGTFDVVAADSTADHGSVTVGGQTLRGYVSTSFQVTAVPFVVVDSGQQTIGGGSGSFSATGLVQLFANVGDATPIFTQEVNGTGTVGIGGINVGNGQFLTSSVGLTFEPTASPTPEPASMLLLGTGLAATWRARRFRHAR